MTFLGLNSDTWQIVGAVVAVVVVLGGIISFIVRSIFNLAAFSGRVSAVEKSVKEVKDELRESTKQLTGRIDNLINLTIQKNLSESNSPRQLNTEGKKVLKNSKIDAVVNDNFSAIVKTVSLQKPQNAYQAEQAILEAVEHLADDPTIRNTVEIGAFQSGYPVAGVLFVGGLFVRDKVLKELGFDTSDIDKHTPKDKV